MSFIINRMSNMSIVPPNFIEKRSSQLSLNLSANNSRQELFNLKIIQIRNAKKQSFHEKKIMVLESITALINIFVIIITISKNLNSHTIDFSYEDQEEFYRNQQIQYRFLMVFSICVVILNIIKNITVAQLQDQAQQPTQNTNKTLIKSWIKILSQTIFYFIHPFSFTKDFILEFTHPPIHLNKILSCLVYIRFILILLFCLKISRFYGLRVNRVLNLYVGDKKDFGILYTIKCYLKENGLKSPFLIYATIMAVFPFFIITVYNKFSIEQNQVTSSSAFLQSIYDIVISMATVGYGDMQHQYILERVIFILIIVMGSSSSSFFTLTFLNWFRLSQQEQKALRSIKRLSLKSEIQELNNSKINGFVHALVQLKKKNQVKQQKLKKIAKKISNNQKNQMQKSDMEHNQNLSDLNKSKHDLKSILPKITTTQKKYLNQRLYDTRDTFKDFYERSQLQLGQSIKLLIERTLLTNNLLQFYLMRQKNNNKSQYLQSSRITDSAETIKSQKSQRKNRVEDSRKMYQIRLDIIKNTYKEKEDDKSRKHLQQQKRVTQ